VFIYGLTLWSPYFRQLFQTESLLGVFLAAAVAMCLFNLQDSVLTALRETVWVPIENAFFAISKIILLIFFAAWLPEHGIFASYTIPAAIALVPTNWFIFRWLIPKHIDATAEQATKLSPQRLANYAALNYVGAMFFQVAATVLPIIVADQVGATINAYFYLPWIFTNGLQMLALNMATSFTVEASRDESKLSVYCRRVMVHNLKLLIPIATVIVLGAPFILNLFGQDYAANATDLLRLLTLSVVPYSITALYIGVARVRNQVKRIVVLQAARLVAVVGGTWVLLPVLGITGVGVVWLVTETVVGGLLLATELRPFIRAKA
jgi:O-antigen/teichoic acid export membrane protein